MTILLEQLRTEAYLPSLVENGNPDQVVVLHDFSEQEKELWIDTLVSEARVRSGDLTAKATRRALNALANTVKVGEDQDGSMLLRSVAVLQRPSGRVSGVVVCQWLIRAERLESEEASIELQLSRPQLYAHGIGSRHEVYEATLLHALRQMDPGVSQLIASLQYDGAEAISWTCPVSARDEPFLQEAHNRLMLKFYGTSETPTLADIEASLAA